jgi:hypothetical protein
MTNTVVARFRDGRVIKGTTLNVDPERATFHVRTADGAVEVKLADLKALFFVKDSAGNPKHQEAKVPTPGDSRLLGGQPIAVEFGDGERIVGVTPRFPPTKPFFFVIPVDPKSNNIRILINRKATVAIRPAPPGTTR